MKRRTVVAVLAVGTLALLYGLARAAADRQLTRLLPAAVAQAVGGRDAGRYDVTLGGLDIALALNGVRIQDLDISRDSAEADDLSEPALVRSAHFTSARIDGLRLLPLLRGEGVYVATIEVDEPVLSLDFLEPPIRSEAGKPAEPTDPPDAASSAFRPPETTLRTVRIRDGSFELKRSTGRGILTSVLRNLDLTLTEIRVDSVSFANPVAALTNSRVTMAFDTVYHVLDDSLYYVVATGVRADSQDSLVEVGTVGFTPTLEAAPFFGRLPKRADRLNVRAGPIRIEGLDFHDYVREAAVHARRIVLDSVDVHVYSDIALDWGARARPCKYHAAFAGIPIPFRIDTIQALAGRIRYSELAKGSDRPGELVFEDVSALLTNLTNDPGGMTPASPAIARLEGRLYGEAPMSAIVRYPLLSPTLDFEVQAAVGGMSLLPVNRFATPVTGVEVREGQLDSLWLELESHAGRAAGQIDLRYRDLDFGLLDRNSGKEMVWHSVLGFLGNVAIRSSNPGKPQDPPKVGSIEYTCDDQDMVFFEFLVHAAVTGLKRIVLIL